MINIYIKFVPLLVFLVILIIASIEDIISMNIPISLSIIGFLVRAIELSTYDSNIFKFYLIFTSLCSALLFIIGGYVCKLGGADCLIGTLCIFYLGINGVWALMISFILAIPYTAYMKIKNNEHEYPFVPFITAGVVIIFSIQCLNIIEW